MRIRTGFVALVVLAAAMPAARAADDFTGMYAGFTLGSNGMKADWYTTETRDPSGNVITTPTSDPMGSVKDSAYGVGVVWGYNWAVGPDMRVGVEAAAGAASAYGKVSNRIPGLGDTSSDPTSYAAVKTNKPLSLGLTGGYVVVPGTLVYVRANFERLRTHAIATCPADTNVCDPAEGSQTFNYAKNRYGWGVGLGVEKSFSDLLSVRLEYVRSEYGKTKEFTAMPESDTTFGADAVVDFQKSNTVTLGVLFHF
jgi:opacity protein-like surface antigen